MTFAASRLESAIGPAYVYRVYDETGDLIYVGCTQDLNQRLATHATASWWAYQAAKVKATVHRSLAIAAEVELELIRAERPRWNIVGKGPRSIWSAQDYDDYITARLNNCDTDATRKTVERVRTERHRRFDRNGQPRRRHLAIEVAS